MKPNLSLQKKSAARLAAVQSLYTLAVTGETRTPLQLVTALKKQLENNRDEQKLLVGAPIEPNYKLVETLLEGVEQWRADIDARLDGALSKDWKRARTGPLLIAILQCGIFEMLFFKAISPKIVIDEYTRLARSFFTDSEAGFVHGVLSKLANG